LEYRFTAFPSNLCYRSYIESLGKLEPLYVASHCNSWNRGETTHGGDAGFLRAGPTHLGRPAGIRCHGHHTGAGRILIIPKMVRSERRLYRNQGIRNF